MLSSFVPWSADECIRAFESQDKKAHQGIAPQNLALHLGIAWSNSTDALGLRSLAVETRVRSRCTGNERDSESGLDDFGARYYASTMGRWMSPDAINLTDERVFNPANTLNKYVYGGNNPLKYVDPDGRDITVFYTNTGPAGHFWMVAYEQTTGESAVMDFGPDKAQSWLIERGLPIDVAGTTNYDAHQETLDQIRQDYTSLTIQTNPEDTQKAIDAIRSFNADNHDWNVTGPNCTTVCRDVLKKILKLDSTSIRPKSLWSDIFKKWSNNALNNPGKTVPVQNQHGIDYGRPRVGIDTFILNWMLLNPPREEVTHKICWTDDKGKKVCQ